MDLCFINLAAFMICDANIFIVCIIHSALLDMKVKGCMLCFTSGCLNLYDHVYTSSSLIGVCLKLISLAQLK